MLTFMQTGVKLCLNKLCQKDEGKEIKKKKNLMHFSMKISYLFSSVYGRARGGGSSAYCGTGSSAWWSHRIYLSCYIIDFPCDESQVLTDPISN